MVVQTDTGSNVETLLKQRVFQPIGLHDTNLATSAATTPQDWQRFLRALASGQLLPPAQLAETTTTVVESPGDANSARCGLGFEEYFSPCGPVWGRTGGIPGYSSENYTDETGTRSVTVVTTTLFGLHDPKAGTADQKVVDAAVCAMLDEPLVQSVAVGGKVLTASAPNWASCCGCRC